MFLVSDVVMDGDDSFHLPSDEEFEIDGNLNVVVKESSDDEDADEVDVADQKEQDTDTFDEEPLEEDEGIEIEKDSSETISKPRPESTPRTVSSEEKRPVARRRSRKPSTNKDGPITSVKRKRLDGKSEVTPQKRTTRKKVVSKPPVRKTRRVVTHADKVDEDSPSER